MLSTIQTQLQAHANPTQAVPMAAYMKHLFPFLGIPAPELSSLLKVIFKENSGKKQTFQPSLVLELLALPEREYHYAASYYLGYLHKQLKPEHFALLETAVTTNAWWDSVDSLRKTIGLVVKAHPKEGRVWMDACLKSDNFWLRRVALNHQLSWKNETDAKWLGEAILSCAHEKEFFIAKAIGWALRDYSYTNPDWVRQFIETHKDKLQPLSVREGSKRLPTTYLGSLS